MKFLVAPMVGVMWWATCIVVARTLGASLDTAVNVALVAGPIGGFVLGAAIGRSAA